MDPEDLAALEDLLDCALAASPSDRPALLAARCAGRPDLRRAAEELLAAALRDGERLDALADEVASRAPLEIEALAHRERRVGPYRVLGLLGRGGMGSVFLAERVDGGFAQKVAIKFVAIGSESPATLARFDAERQILAGLEHPGIARLLDGGATEEGRPYLVLEHVAGEPITAYCDRTRASVRRRLELFLEVVEAVRYAHSRLVVHRDLKPSNLWIGEDGHPKLLDFGIAKLLAGDATATRSLDRPGTLLYAAPEQLDGGAITTATDVYGLGTVLYELLTANRPFAPGATRGDLERRILEEPPLRPSRRVERDADAAAARATTPRALARQLAGDLDTICEKALAKEPSRRYGSVDELAADVKRHLSGRVVHARPATLRYRLAKYVRRHRLGVAAATAAALLSAAFVALLAVQAADLRRERDRAERIAAFFTGLFELADPGEARGATVTVREVVDHEAGELLSGPQGEPALAAELAEVVAGVYRGLGLYERATTFAERSLELRRGAAGEAPAELVAAIDRLGELWRLRGDFRRARAHLDEAIALARRTLSPDEPQLADALLHSGRTHLAAGDLDRARVDLEEAFAVHTRARGRDSLAAAEDLVALAGVAASRGDLAAAQPLLAEALAIQRVGLGDDHPAVATTTSDLATVLARLGDLDAAIVVGAEAVAQQQHLHGPDHPRVATALNNLGTMHLARGKYRAAEPLLAESLAIRRRVLDAQHPDLAQSLANLGLLLQIVGRFEESAALQREALAIRRAALGPRHVLVAQAIHNRGLLEQALGDPAAAERSMLESLELLRALLPARHPLIAINLHNLGSLAHQRGRAGDAEQLYREALAIRRDLAPGGHPDVALSLVGLARLLAETGRASEAESLAREAFERRQRDFEPASFEVVEARAVLGGTLLARGAAEGGVLLRQALGELDRLAEPRHDAEALRERIAAQLSARR